VYVLYYIIYYFREIINKEHRTDIPADEFPMHSRDKSRAESVPFIHTPYSLTFLSEEPKTNPISISSCICIQTSCCPNPDEF